MHPARPRAAKSWKALFDAAGSVEGNADEKENDGKHDNAGENFHGYNLPIWSMRRSI